MTSSAKLTKKLRKS